MGTTWFWETLENPPEYGAATIRLMDWSQNFDYPSPMSLFLDLIGFSEEELGQRLCAEKMPSLGYLELDYLADALKEYANRPLDVYALAERLANEETLEDRDLEDEDA